MNPDRPWIVPAISGGPVNTASIGIYPDFVAERDRLSQAQLERRLARALKRSLDLDVQSIDGYDSAAEYLTAHPESVQLLVLGADHPDAAGLETALERSGCALITCDRRHRL